MKAIIETCGKQYTCEEGTVLYLEKLDNEAGSEVSFDKVLYVDGEVGRPYVEGAKVVGTIEKHGKQKKIRIYKYKNKCKTSRRTQGHRQPYTKVVIKTIKK